MFIGERNYNGQDAVKLFWEAITIMVKEYYTSLHIDVRSRKAINGLGYFAVKYADRKESKKVMMILAMVPYISLIKFIERELVDTMEMIMKICAMMFFAF
uniref:Uncharacterized protein n=1 Tax=Meloidogyne incognita TaxID=6306 RepID=A0A914LBT5_MELIC